MQFVSHIYSASLISLCRLAANGNSGLKSSFANQAG